MFLSGVNIIQYVHPPSQRPTFYRCSYSLTLKDFPTWGFSHIIASSGDMFQLNIVLMNDQHCHDIGTMSYHFIEHCWLWCHMMSQWTVDSKWAWLSGLVQASPPSGVGCGIYGHPSNTEGQCHEKISHIADFLVQQSDVKINIGQGLRVLLLFILTILMEYFHGYNFVSEQKSNASLYAW